MNLRHALPMLPHSPIIRGGLRLLPLIVGVLAANAAPTHTRLLLNGDAAPGGLGTFSVPPVARALTSTGEAVFLNGTSTTEGIFAGRPGSLRALVTLATPVPGPWGRTFISLNGSIIGTHTVSRRGDVVFYARSTVTGVSGSLAGLFLRTAAGTLHRLAHDGDAAPGGSFYKDMHLAPQPVISGNGRHVVFKASLAGVPGMGIYHAQVQGGGAVTVERVAHLSGPSPDGGTFSSLEPFPNVRGMRAVNDSGLVIFSANTSAQAQPGHLFAWDGTALALVPNSGWAEHMMLNNAGQITMVSGGGSINDDIYLGTVAGLAAIVGTGDPAPGGGTFGVNVGQPVLNEAGQIAFTAGQVNGGAGGSGIYLWETSGIKFIARQSDLPPGGGLYTSFSSVSDNPLLSDSGWVYFLNDLNGGFNQFPTIFRGNGTELVRVIGEGDALDGELVRDVDMALTSSDLDEAESMSGLGPLNARGYLLYWAQLDTTGKRGLYIYNPDLPEPDIVVRQPAVTDIPPGGSRAFGSVVVGNASTLTFTIANTGALELTDLEVTLDGADAALFHLVAPGATTLASAGTIAFNVEFAPTGTGAKAAALHIASNDPDESPYDITLSGTGAAPPAAVVKTLPATAVTHNSATLNGTVNAKGSARAVAFDHGLTTSYGSTTNATPASVNGSADTPVSASLTGLLPHTKYNFRVRAVGAPGAANGANVTFTTLNRAPIALADAFAVLPGATVTLPLLANDSDADGDVLSLAANTALIPAAAGRLVRAGNALVFTAATTGFAGGAFTYTVKDAFGGTSASAAVTLTPGTCALNTLAVNVPSAAVTYPVVVTATGAWSVVESLPWVTVSPLHGSGDGVVQVTLSGNTSKVQRVGSVVIGGVSHGITQAEVLLPVLSPPPLVPQAIVSGTFALLIPTQNLPVTYTVTKLPPGLTLSGETGILGGKPTLAGSYPMTIKAANAAGTAVTTLSFTLVVQGLPAGLVGVFNGLVERHADFNDNLGSRLELTTTLTGAVSGKIITGVTAQAFKGQLNADPATPGDPTFQTTLPRKIGAPLLLDLMLQSDTQTLSGEVAEPGVDTAPVQGWRNIWNAANKVPAYYRRLHTFVLMQDAPDGALPQGHGYGSWPTVAETTGTMTVAGRLADGGSFTTGGFIGRQGQVLLYQSLYANKGSFAGVLTLTPHDAPGAAGSLSGTPTWLKPAPAVGSKDTTYKNGFGPADLSAQGGAYPVPAPGDVVMGLPDNTSDNARLFFSEGGLDTESAEFDLTLKLYNPGSALVNKADIPPHPNMIKMPVLDAVKGQFSGEFTVPGATPAQNRKVPYQGQIVKLPTGATQGYGFFLLPESTATTAKKHSGKVLLQNTTAP